MLSVESSVWDLHVALGAAGEGCVAFLADAEGRSRVACVKMCAETRSGAEGARAGRDRARDSARGAGWEVDIIKACVLLHEGGRIGIFHTVASAAVSAHGAERDRSVAVGAELFRALSGSKSGAGACHAPCIAGRGDPGVYVAWVACHQLGFAMFTSKPEERRSSTNRLSAFCSQR